MKSRRTAFTLIELLVVVAIISILSSIAVVNFSEATTRSKVTRVQADMRTMATAVETYMVDNNKYPIRHHRYQSALAETNPAEYMMHHAPFTEKVYDPDPGDERNAVGLHVLTTPIAYLTCLPRDIFNIPAQSMIKGTAYFAYG